MNLLIIFQAGQKSTTLPNVAKTKAEKERERKIGHRRVGVGGEITYKKIQSSQIMGSIQLGKLTIILIITGFNNRGCIFY